MWWRSFALWALSVLRWRAGDHAGATTAAMDSLEVGTVVEDEQFTVGLSLEALGWVAGSERRDQRAAHLLGASDRMWRAMQASLSSFRSMRDFHDEATARLRERLGDRAFEAAFARGTTLTAPRRWRWPWTGCRTPLGPTPARLRRPRPARAGRTSCRLGLTRREREVAALVAEGLTNREIAARLVVAQRTAEGHVENILSKLGFTSRSQVAAWLAAQR